MLTTESVHRRILRGENPMDISLEKWQVFLNAAIRRDIDELRTHSLSYKTCGLCISTINMPVGDWHPFCHNCPIGKLTCASGCHGTPYYDVANAYFSIMQRRNDPTTSQWDTLIKALRREIDFLKAVAKDEGRDWLDNDI